MKPMPHLRTWQRMLAHSRGEQPAEALAAQVQARYRQLVANHPRHSSRAQRQQLEGLILPGLAVYQILSAEGRSRPEVLAEVQGLFEAAFFARLRSVLPWLNALPDPFPLVRLGLRWTSGNAYGAGSQVIVEDSQQCLELHVRRCYILDTLQCYQAAELAPLYCKTDDWLAACLPRMGWQRTRTLANGDDRCDFRWSRGGG